MARRKARELAFQTLFQAERGEHDLWTVWEDVRVSSTADINDDDEGDVYGDPLDYQSLEFAQSLLRQFANHRTALDNELSESLEGWTFSQMSQTDLTILRLALTELRYMADIPAQVTIEVAVRIAKKFGGEESGRFVNGVLGRLFEGQPTTNVQAPSDVQDTAMSSQNNVSVDDIQADVVQADVVQADVVQADVVQADAIQIDTVQADATQVDDIQADAVQTEVASEENNLVPDVASSRFNTEVL